MDGVQVIAVNSGRLWREGLAELLEGTEFIVHPDPDRAVANSKFLDGLDGRAILLYRERGLPGNSADWIRCMRRSAPTCKIVVVTSEFRLDAFRQAMEAGADGFLIDDMSGRIFIRMLGLVVDGEKVVPSSLAALVTGNAVRSDPSSLDAELATFSRCESEILRRVTHGESNKQIANSLSLSESTVKRKVTFLLRKIHVSNRTQAAIWWMNHELGVEGSLPAPKALDALRA